MGEKLQYLLFDALFSRQNGKRKTVSKAFSYEFLRSRRVLCSNKLMRLKRVDILQAKSKLLSNFLDATWRFVD